MTILVTYFSQSHNTEKVAAAIHAEVSANHDAEIMKLDAVDLNTLKQYDIIFMGSPIHAGSIATEVANFLEQMPELPGISLAGFITHAAPVYPQQKLEQMAQAYADACETNRMVYKGCFNCQGYLADAMHAAVQQMQGVDDAEWQRKIAQMSGHPNEADLRAAKEFAIAVLVDECE